VSKRVVFAIPLGTPVTKCRSCGADICWVTTGATAKKPGRMMPVNVAGAEKNVLGEAEGESHFATCPDADRWRKSR